MLINEAPGVPPWLAEHPGQVPEPPPWCGGATAPLWAPPGWFGLLTQCSRPTEELGLGPHFVVLVRRLTDNLILHDPTDCFVFLIHLFWVDYCQSITLACCCRCLCMLDFHSSPQETPSNMCDTRKRASLDFQLFFANTTPPPPIFINWVHFCNLKDTLIHFVWICSCWQNIVALLAFVT